MDKPEPKPALDEERRGRRWTKPVLILLGLLLALIAVAPWLIAKTSLRNLLFSAAVQNEAIQIDSRDASFGYFSPLRLEGLRIQAGEEEADIEIDEIKAEKSWLGILVSAPNLGGFTFVRPSVDVLVSKDLATDLGGETEDATPAEAPLGPLPTLTATIQDASIKVRTPEADAPVVDLDGINVTFHIDDKDDHSLLVIDPIVVFDHAKITPELSSNGLQLVAPLLANEVSAEGEFSFRLETFEIPVAAKDEDKALQDIQIRGVVELHSARVGMQDTLTSSLLDLTAKLLGESIPEYLTVAEGVQVQFEVVDGRVHHEGLAFVLPHKDDSISIESSGSVGLDESLDLQVAVSLPDGLFGDGKLASQLTKEPITVHIGGSLDSPEIGLPDDQTWATRLTDLFPAAEAATEGLDVDDELVGQISDLVGGLLDRAATRSEERSNSPNRDRGRLLPGRNRNQSTNETNEATADDADDDPEPLFPRLRDRLRNRRER